jgi:hypothetical protein
MKYSYLHLQTTTDTKTTNVTITAKPIMIYIIPATEKKHFNKKKNSSVRYGSNDISHFADRFNKETLKTPKRAIKRLYFTLLLLYLKHILLLSNYSENDSDTSYKLTRSSPLHINH